MNTNTSKGLLAGLSIDDLKKRTTTDPYKEYWNGICERWRRIADWEARTEGYRNIGSCGGGQITWFVREAALIYRLTGNEDYLKLALRQFDAILAQGVGSSRHGPKRVDDDGAVIRGSGGGRIFATSYTSLMAFVASAQRAGLLDMYEYP